MKREKYYSHKRTHNCIK